MLPLLATIKVHNVSHVALLKNYVHDSNCFVDWALSILDRKVIVLINRATGQVKVQWTHYSPEEATWELEDAMHETYMHLF
jgi:hypothetical protein